MKTKFCKEICLTVCLLFLFPSLSFARSYGRSGYGDAFTTFGIGFLIFLVIFLLFREINCWYWKINERLSVEKETLDVLKKISKKLSNLSTGNSPDAVRTEQEQQEQDEKEMVKIAKVKEVIDMYLKEDYSFKYGEELDELIKRKAEIKCLHCGKRLPSEISSFCNNSHREAFFNSIDKYIER